MKTDFQKMQETLQLTHLLVRKLNTLAEKLEKSATSSGVKDVAEDLRLTAKDVQKEMVEILAGD